MTGNRRIRFGSGAVLVGLAVAVLAGCAQATPGTGPDSSPASSSATPAAGTGSGSPGSRLTPPAGGRMTVQITEADSGRTITLGRGDTVVVTLHSTYWSFGAAPAASILQAQGSPVVTALAPGNGCMPGGGCGTVSWTLVAAGPGSARVTASRTTCGEAMACGPGQSSFNLNVVVDQSRP